MGLVLLLFVHCNQNCPRFPPCFQGQCHDFCHVHKHLRNILILPFPTYISGRKSPFSVKCVQVHMMSYTTTPQKSPKRRYLSRSMPTGIKSMLSFWNDYSDFHSKQIYSPVIFFYMGISILKNTKKMMKQNYDKRQVNTKQYAKLFL